MLFVMNLGRVVYAYLFLDLFQAKTNLDLTIKAIFLGLRYDLIAISYILFLPFLLAWTILLNPRDSWMTFVIRFSHFWIFFLFSLVTVILVCDLGFYSYFQDHINVLFFGLFEDDTKAVFISIWKNYNVPFWALLIIFIFYSLWKVLAKIFSQPRIDLNYMKPLKLKTLFFIFFALLTILIFLSRGNFSRLPLSIEDSRIGPIPSINHLSLNGIIAINRALRIRRVYGKDDVNYMKKFGYQKLEDVFNDFNKEGRELSDLYRQTPINEKVVTNPPHVIVIVNESFGGYWWNYQSERFNFLGELEKNIKEDFLTLNMMPSDNGTIGSITSIVSGLPIRPGSRVLSEGLYMNTSLDSAIHMPYKKAGYKTHFVYGGKLGWRKLGDYLVAQKFDHVVGADEIRSNNNLSLDQNIGNEWGLFDEFLFDYISKALKEAQEPQFILVLTTSNHPPFEVPNTYPHQRFDIPEEMFDLFSKSKEDVALRFRTLRYSNDVIGKFINFIKSDLTLRDKTVIGVTGDHSFWMAKKLDPQEVIKRYRVPFYLYLPTELRPTETISPIGSHLDIAPTLYELTLSGAKYFSLGRSLFLDQTMALNGSLLFFNQEYLIFQEQTFCINEMNFDSVNICPHSEGHEAIIKYKNAMMGLTDEFLRLHYRK